MSRWRAIPLFQRVLLVMLAAMPVFFAALYFILNGRLGVEYGGSLLLRSVQGETTLYAGRVDGKEAVFAVSPDGRVTYRFDGGDYGPYIVVEDPGAVPRDHDMADVLTGVEVRRGDEILFRGGWLDGGISVLIDESGAPVSSFSFSWHAGGKAYGPDGQEMDFSHEPSVSFLLPLVLAPVLRHRGDISLYWLATCLAAVGILSILFADRLFRWNLGFLIRDPELAEPSDWELFGRRLGWIVCTGGALVGYLVGVFSIV